MTWDGNDRRAKRRHEDVSHQDILDFIQSQAEISEKWREELSEKYDLFTKRFDDFVIAYQPMLKRLSMSEEYRSAVWDDILKKILTTIIFATAGAILLGAWTAFKGYLS